MEQFKVLISDKVAEKCVKNLQDNGIDVDFKPGLPAEDLKQIIKNYDGLIVRSATKVTSEVIEQADNLKVIGRAGTGVDNIDVPKATEKQIAVLNSKRGNTISAAEHSFALMIALARNIPQAQISMKEGKWERSSFGGIELNEKKLGVIGLGQIGKEVAKRAQAFNMTVVAYDPLIEAAEFEKLGITQMEISDMLKECDFITLHLPLNDKTRNLISDKEFDMCNKNLRLINVARGGIINEEALYKAAKDGKIAGAAIDVYVNEPPGDTPLTSLSNVITTPHLGASTIDAQERIAVEIAENVCTYLKEKHADSIVNPQVLG